MDTRTYLGPAHSGWEPFEPFYVNGAAYGGLLGTAVGFVRYLQGLLDPGSALLSDGSRRMLFADHVLSGGRPFGMGLSWHLGNLSGPGLGPCIPNTYGAAASAGAETSAALNVRVNAALSSTGSPSA